MSALIRDKLYGILSLVDWEGNPRPSKDYSKDDFQVSVNALKLVAMYESPQKYLSMWTRAQDTLWVFGITLAAASLRKAIEIRSGSFEESMLLSSSKLGTSVNIEEPGFSSENLRTLVWGKGT